MVEADITPVIQFVVHWMLHLWGYAFRIGPVSMTISNFYFGTLIAVIAVCFLRWFSGNVIGILKVYNSVAH